MQSVVKFISSCNGNYFVNQNSCYYSHSSVLLFHTRVANIIPACLCVILFKFLVRLTLLFSLPGE
uniref:Uncharacterized protein n=1 Tax=Rhizophora mucronata TaxID=61149 RepID=A0A2P2PKI2_RHIMU